MSEHSFSSVRMCYRWELSLHPSFSSLVELGMLLRILWLDMPWARVVGPELANLFLGECSSQSGCGELSQDLSHHSAYLLTLCRIVFSMPLGVLSYVMLWYTPQDTMSPGFSFGWYFTWCCLFDSFMSVRPLLCAYSFLLFYTFKDISCIGGRLNSN